MSVVPFSLPVGSRLFLTGGTGSVGRSILRYLKKVSHGSPSIDITVLTRDPSRFVTLYPALAENVRLVRGDVRNLAVPVSGFSHVLHAATETSIAAAARPRELIETIVAGTSRVIDFASACGAKKMLFLSSGAVYGRQPERLACLPESYDGTPDARDPASSYGNAKRLAEQMCSLASQAGLEISIARLFAFVGPDLPRDGPFAIGNFIRDALEGGPIRVQGDGSPVRSYLYQEDLVVWLLTLLERGHPGRAYNVGSDQAVTISELAHLVSRTIGNGCKVEIAKGRADYPGRLRYVPSIDLAREELQLAPWTGLDEALRRTAAALP